MRIYISHPYGDKEENKIKVENIIRQLTEICPQDTFISPIHTFGFMYNDVNYETGLGWCLDLLEGCHKMYVFGDWKQSRGCTAEVLYAETHMIPYVIEQGEGREERLSTFAI